jgi:hypothetical protein
MADRNEGGATAAVAARLVRRCRDGVQRPIVDPGSPLGPPPDVQPDAVQVGFCCSQPTGGSRVGIDGETQLRRALNKAPVSCRTSQEANALVLWLARDVELEWTRCSASLHWQGSRD